MLPLYECKRCKHKWIPRKEKVQQCPKCRSHNWDKEKNKEKKQIKIALMMLFSLFLVLPLISASTGIGLRWTLIEATVEENSRQCVTYGLYNPFGTDVRGYLEVTGELIELTNYAKEYHELEDLEEKVETKKEEYKELDLETRGSPTPESKEKLGILDEEIRQLENERRDLNEKIEGLKDKKIVDVKAGTFHNETVDVEICFDIPSISKCLINSESLGKYFCKKCITKFYSGEVYAKYLKEAGIGGTGSQTGSSVSAPLKIKVRCSESKTPYLLFIAIILILVIVIFFIVKKLKKRKI